MLTIDGDEHFERRRLEAQLFAKAALDYYEHSELIPLIDKTLEECRDNRGDDGVVRADLCVLLRTMLARIAATTGIDGVDTAGRGRWRHLLPQSQCSRVLCAGQPAE